MPLSSVDIPYTSSCYVVCDFNGKRFPVEIKTLLRIISVRASDSEKTLPRFSAPIEALWVARP